MYLWVKVIHILAVVSWMAGLFYLPRLFVYHADKSPGSDADLTFKTMERRLLNAIMRPACVVSVASGVWLAWSLGLAFEVWFVVKVLAVVAMLGYHGLLERHRAQFARDVRGPTASYFRVINEIPTVLLIVIVIAVVVKPFS